MGTKTEIATLGAMALSLTLKIGLVVYGSYTAYNFNQAINKYVNEPVEQRANVTGNKGKELYIDRNGKKFYAEIDEKSVEDLVKESK